MKKFCLTFVSIAFLSCPLPSLSLLFAVEDGDPALEVRCATASLLYHIESLLPSPAPPEDQISFSAAQIRKLWQIVSKNNSELKQPLNCYYLGQQRLETDTGQQLWMQTYFALYSKWTNLSENEKLARLLTKILHPPSSVESPLPANIFSKLTPYLLPRDDPAKPILDALFTNTLRPLDSAHFKKAGFTLHEKKKGRVIYRHSLIPAYLVEAIFRNEEDSPHWQALFNPCQKTHKIKEALVDCKSLHFDVNEKWIYPFPFNPSPSHSEVKWGALLLATHKETLSREETLKAWKVLITKEHLKELYRLISSPLKLVYTPDKMRYSRSGKFIFIDLEECIAPRPDFGSIRPFLTEEMRLFWDRLVQTAGIEA